MAGSQKQIKRREEDNRLLTSFFYHLQVIHQNDLVLSKDKIIEQFWQDQEDQRLAYQSWADWEKEMWRHNKRLLRVIKKVKGNTFYRYLIQIIKECERVMNKMTIEKKPGGEWQQERYGRTITGIWCDQWATGTEGDSWDGHVWVKLKENKYLKISYSM